MYVCVYYYIHITHAGTHYVINASIMDNNKAEVTIVYSEHPDAKGALVNFAFIDDDNAIDFMRSALLVLDRNISHEYTLPFNLFPGKYRVSVYDIERDGTLSGGIGYPAVVRDVVLTSEVGKGKYY